MVPTLCICRHVFCLCCCLHLPPTAVCCKKKTNKSRRTVNSEHILPVSAIYDFEKSSGALKLPPLTSNGKKGWALLGLLFTRPAMIMKTTSSTCMTVITMLNLDDSFVPRVRRNVRNRHQANAHLQQQQEQQQQCRLAKFAL